MFLLITSSVGIVRPISLTRKPRLEEMKQLALSTKEGRSLGLEPRVAWLEAFPPDPAESYQRKVGLWAGDLHSSWTLASPYLRGP